MPEYNANNQNKLSPEFATRLTQLEPQQRVRVIILLQLKEAENLIGKRQSHPERKAAMQAIRDSAEKALGDIDSIIKNFDGQPLVEHPDLLGSIPIEITAAGVNALAKSDAVKAVIEDQAIHQGY
jgi:hypothetical protein